MMYLHDVIRPDLIKINMEAEKKREAISELMDVLVQYHEVPMNQRDVLLNELYANEHNLGSGMEHGIALPHLATDRVDEVICAVGTSANGIPFGSLDGKLTKVVVLLLLPRKNFEGEVLALAGVQHLLSNKAIVTNLLKATNSVDACRLIEDAEKTD